MSNIAEHVLPQEQILYATPLSKIIFLTPVLVTLALVYFIVQIKTSPLIIYGACLVVLFYWLQAMIRYLSCEYAVTTSRIMLKEGWLQTRMLEMLLARIESVQVEQSFLGRLLNYGLMVIDGTGGSRDQFGPIANPKVFREHILTAVEKVLTHLN